MNFYKYYPPESINHIFKSDSISLRFSQPRVFEDLEDCNTGFKKSNYFTKSMEKALIHKEKLNGKPLIPTKIKNALLNKNREINYKLISELMPRDDENDFLEKSYEIFNNEFGILCLTNSKKSAHLWENYSKSHTGFMIEIRINEIQNGNFSKIRKVTYHKDPSYNISNHDDYYERIFRKSNTYIKEEEHRIISSLSTLKESGEDQHKNVIYCSEINYSEIISVYFGYDISNKLKEEIMHNLKDFKHIKFYQSVSKKHIIYHLIRHTSDTPKP